jgi:ABC-type multidrug transport system fused ATPase/permease subunit
VLAWCAHSCLLVWFLQIVVLDAGEVVEQGTHTQLLARSNGRYAALVNAQELTLESTLM